MNETIILKRCEKPSYLKCDKNPVELHTLKLDEDGKICSDYVLSICKYPECGCTHIGSSYVEIKGEFVTNPKIISFYNITKSELLDI